MDSALPRSDLIARAPDAFRDALAELVQIGLSVARMVGRAAEAETTAAEAVAQLSVSDDIPPIATSLAEAIEQDRAYAAAAEARQTVVARANIIAATFAKVSRSIRLTVAMAERLDRGWARRSAADDREAMARRQVARRVTEVIGHQADGERAERLTEALTERLDVADELSSRPIEEVITEICRDLGLEAARMTMHPPLKEAARFTEEDGAAPPARADRRWEGGPPSRRPDG